MSKVVKTALGVLVFLLVISVAVAVLSLLQKQSLEQQNQGLQSQLADYQNKETKLLAQAKRLEKDQKDLSDRLGQSEKDKQGLQQTYDDLKSRSDDLNNQINQITQERDDWKGRLETIRKERDDLMQKLKDRPAKVIEKVVYKDREPAAQEEDAGVTPAVTSPQGDEYWAKVLKEKAALQIALDKAKGDADQSALTLGEIRKQNADLQMELKNLTDAKQEVDRKLQEDRDEFARKLKYSEDLSNNLSMEVARARNDQKASEDRTGKIKAQNMALQDQIKQLTGTKLALEKTIASINQDKNKIQNKLDQTEGVIQSRIDEIWKIKQSLDQKITQLPSQSGGEVELPPIIINANSQGQAQTQMAMPSPGGSKSQGTIISVNAANNFVIVDLGEADGSAVGRSLTVYRDNNPIGNLQVIQVRKDISAADIKQGTAQLKVGDIVRY